MIEALIETIRQSHCWGGEDTLFLSYHLIKGLKMALPHWLYFNIKVIFFF